MPFSRLTTTITELLRKIRIRKHPHSPDSVPSTSTKTCIPDVLARTQQARRRMILPMLYPRDTVIASRETITAKASKKSSTSTVPSISLSFEVDNEGTTHRISLKRPVDEPFVDIQQKVMHKLNKTINGKPSKSAPSSYSRGGSFMNFTFKPQDITDEEMKCLLLSDVIASPRNLIVGDRVMKIVVDPLMISYLEIVLTPVVGRPVIAAVDFNNDSTTETVSVTCEDVCVYHWFVEDSVSSGNSNQSIPQLSFEAQSDEGRTFSVSNYSFVGRGQVFIPSEIHVGKRIAVVCDIGVDSPVRLGISRTGVESVKESPLYEERVRNLPTKTNGSLRVVSYNILADLYLNLDKAQEELFFPYCPREFQTYQYRYPLLLAELKAYNADIFVLQEVDFRFQMRYLAVLTQNMNLNLRFAKKGFQVNEGSAVLYNRDLFSEISSEVYLLASLISEAGNQDLKEILLTNEEDLNIFQERATILHVVQLVDNKTNDIVVVANTHLHHKPSHDYIKVLQAVVCTRKLSELCEEAEKSEKKTRLLFAGDFNSTPDGSVYQLLSTGTLPQDHKCWSLSKKLKPKTITLPTKWLNGLPNLSGTPEFTNYTRYRDSDGTVHGFAGCLDFVWSDGFECSYCSPLPSEDKLSLHKAIPAVHQPSDHLPLIVDIMPK